VRPTTVEPIAHPTIRPVEQAANEDDAGKGLVLRGIRRGWPRRAEPVLEGVDLSAGPGTVTWIGGANGAGKTTLLRVAAGILAAEAGEVRFGPLDPEADRVRYQENATLVSAGDRGLYARISVRRHLDIQARLAFVPRAERSPRIAAVLEHFGLVDLAASRTDRLSLGQRQRVRLALAFLHDPRLVLLDEPANSLDEAGLMVLLGAVRRVVARGGVVIWCSPPHERAVIPSDAELQLRDGALTPE
jgi:ABC-2 type transport system ATP-binding protein